MHHAKSSRAIDVLELARSKAALLDPQSFAGLVRANEALDRLSRIGS